MPRGFAGIPIAEPRFEITWRADVYADAPQESSGAKFGIQGINVRARKPQTEEEWAAELEKLACAIGE